MANLAAVMPTDYPMARVSAFPVNIHFGAGKAHPGRLHERRQACMSASSIRLLAMKRLPAAGRQRRNLITFAAAPPASCTTLAPHASNAARTFEPFGTVAPRTPESFFRLDRALSVDGAPCFTSMISTQVSKVLAVLSGLQYRK